MSGEKSDLEKSNQIESENVTPAVPRKRGLPVPDTIFEGVERAIHYGVHGFVVGSILGLVTAGGSARGSSNVGEYKLYGDAKSNRVTS